MVVPPTLMLSTVRRCVFICVGARFNGVEIPSVHEQVPLAHDGQDQELCYSSQTSFYLSRALDLISQLARLRLRRDDEAITLLCVFSRQPRSLPATDLSQKIDIMAGCRTSGSRVLRKVRVDWRTISGAQWMLCTWFSIVWALCKQENSTPIIEVSFATLWTSSESRDKPGILKFIPAWRIPC